MCFRGGGSVIGIYAVSTAAKGSNRIDAAGTLGNSSRRTSSSPDRNSHSSKLNLEDTEVIENLN